MLGVHLKIIIRFNFKKWFLFIERNANNKNSKSDFWKKNVKRSFKINSGINPFMFLLPRITVKRAKDAHGLQRNKLLLGFVWVKYVLVEWLLFFRIMGTDPPCHIDYCFARTWLSVVPCWLYRKSIVNRWSVSRYLVMNSIKERFDSMDGTESEAVQKIQERFQQTDEVDKKVIIKKRIVNMVQRHWKCRLLQTNAGLFKGLSLWRNKLKSIKVIFCLL